MVRVIVQGMSQITVALPDGLAAEVEKRAKAAGFGSKEDYLLELVKADCELSRVEQRLKERVEGPFEPLEADWMDRVRDVARRRG
jgi:hypothetical protein